ncbi:unnamed protein product [Cyclocybe aegerita]|uniref:DUF6534 domain-containing protein n=1 Tax=Cyclocybe aegerita TaxID=1973307 RepID=A0A8S0XMD7_CYCAE|nr:unnamed protein product [Cyclocybe aegerita]
MQGLICSSTTLSFHSMGADEYKKDLPLHRFLQSRIPDLENHHCVVTKMPDTSLLFGPLLIGVCLNMILYGVSLVQSFIYYQTYKQDAAWIRYFVLYLFVLETANTGFNIGLLYEPLVLHYGDPRSFIISPLMLIADPIVTVMVSTPVQFFIAWRIKVIGNSLIMPIVIVFLGTCAFIGGIALTVCVSYMREWSRFTQFEGAVITWLAAAAAADLLITGSLSWSLNRRRTGIKATDDKVSRIIRLTVQTGLITAIFALADVLIFLTVKGTTLNFIWDLPLSKLYTNSLLSTLNSRAGWGNLTGQSTEDTNVLFARSERRRPGNAVPHHSISGGMSGVIELEPTGTQASEHRVKFGSSIAVTTVVERTGDGVYKKSMDNKV